MNECFTLIWGNKQLHIGKKFPIAVNQLVGINKISQYDDCLKKIDMWDSSGSGPDIIYDVSMLSPTSMPPIWKYALGKKKYIVGTVPSYFLTNKSHVSKQELLTVIENLLVSGVKIITIHPTVTFKLLELSKKRLTPMTSRGGAIVARDMTNNHTENIFIEVLDDIALLCVKYDAAISIGTAFRPANIFDSLDAVHREEIKLQTNLAEYLKQQMVKTIIELPGHTPPKKIKELNSLLKDNNFPIMPLGPVVTDVGIGMDHITSSIGQILLSEANNVQIISAMTAEEHTGNIPSIESTYEAVKVARLVAHIIDMEKFNDFSGDYEIAKQRRSTCVIGAKNKGCARCGEFCPLNLDL